MQRPLPAPHVVPTDDSGVDGTSLHPALTASLHPINTSMSGTFISPSLQCGQAQAQACSSCAGMRAGAAAGTGGSLASSSGRPSGVLRLTESSFSRQREERHREERLPGLRVNPHHSSWSQDHQEAVGLRGFCLDEHHLLLFLKQTSL